MMANMETVEVSRSVTQEKSSKSKPKVVATSSKKSTATKGQKKAAKSQATTKKAVAKKTASKTVAKPKTKQVAKTTVKSKGKRQIDDLTKIEGIGPKIAGLLNADGIYTFKELSVTKVKTIQAILDKAGPRYRMHSPTTWPKQSKMAANGKWDALKKWQDELDGGRK